MKAAHVRTLGGWRAIALPLIAATVLLAYTPRLLSQQVGEKSRDAFAAQLTNEEQGMVDFGITFLASGTAHHELIEHYQKANEDYVQAVFMNTGLGKAVFEHGFTSFVITNGTHFWWANPCLEGFCQPKGPSDAPPPREQTSCKTIEGRLAYCKSWAADTKDISVYCGGAPTGIGVESTAYCPRILVDWYYKCRRASSGNCTVSVTDAELRTARQEIKDEEDRIKRRNELEAVRCTASDPRSPSEQASDPKCIEQQRQEAQAEQDRERERQLKVITGNPYGRIPNITTCNNPEVKPTVRVGVYLLGESVCDALKKAGIPVGKLPEIEENKFGLTPPSTSDAEEMIETLFKGSSQAYNLVFDGFPPNATLKQVWLFTKSPFATEQARLVARYGTPAQEQSKWSDSFGVSYREAIWLLPNNTSIDLSEDGVQNAEHGFLRFTRILYLER